MEDPGKGIKEFWRLVVQVWREGALGIEIGEMLIALGIFVLFFVLRGLFTRFVIRRLEALAARTDSEIDDRMIKALEAPLRFIPVVIGVFFALEALEPAGVVADVGGRLIRALIAYNIFWLMYRLVDPLSFLVENLKAVITQAMVEWLVKAVKAGIMVIGAMTILEIWGIAVGPIIAGLGLLGVAVALGAQDLFKNLISGILIIAENRFDRGDWVKVDGVVEGTVERFGFRSTMVRRFDKAPVFVPNAKLSDNSLTNYTKMSHRRTYWTIGVEYRTTADQLRAICNGIETYIHENDAFAKPPDVPLFVRVDKFGPSSIDIMVYCFTITTVWGEWLAIKQDLAYKVKEIVEGAGASFAFPSQSLYVESFPPGAPEPFVPPAA